MTLSSEQVTPAHLWVGRHKELVTRTKTWLQHFFGNCNACGTCSTCRAIDREQHHAVTWLSPERSYVLEDIQPLFRTVAFALDAGKHHVFVVQQADLLTHTCSNSLLKSIEEPPAGYHFIFLTERLDDILPTIRSRCILQTYMGNQSSNSPETLSSFFLTTHVQNPQAFLKELEQRKPSENTTRALLDEIFSYWLSQLQQALVAGDAKKRRTALRVITLLRITLTRPLMPGSSKLLWRDLFLQIQFL